ncbi:MAG: hypothetical protein ACTHNQ_11325 [Microbacterium sp.]|uniref:hypothetical protein n=1 Tax=Microbacterium sp. TaxID=51671 RepID=UPI003F8198CF
MSDVDNQGSLPSYVEHESGRSARAEDLPPDAAPDAFEVEADEERARAQEAQDASTPRSPFEPSTGEPHDPEGESGEADLRGGG